MRFTFLVAALMVLAPTGGRAQTATETLVDRFIAVLPDSGRLNRIDRSADPAELARLTALNPERPEAIRPVLEEHRACESAAMNAVAEQVLRELAGRLGDAKLSRLIQFYEGDDLSAFEALKARSESGGSMSDSDRAELDRIMAAYPLMEFHRSFGSAFAAFAGNADFLAALDRCAEAKQAALGRLDLRAE